MPFVCPTKFHIDRPPADTERGFALVIALSLMAFIILILLTVVTLVQVETKASANAIQRLQSRQNALLGLQVALGQLQGEVGPDQRVTGRADLLDTDASTVAADGVDAPFWTGAWKSYNPATGANNELDFGTSPTLRSWSTDDEGPAWLVSNPDPATPLDPLSWTGQTTGADPDAVVIAQNIGALGAGGTATDVIVPLVPIDSSGSTNQSRGHFAYWIEDEGIKAKVNSVPNVASELASGSSAEDQALNARHYLAPATLAGEKALAIDYQTTFIDAFADLEKLISTQSLGSILGADFQTADDGYAQSHPDITTWSRGVLADVRKGGLKTDLTAAFESLDPFLTLISRPPPGRDATDEGEDDEIGGKLWRVPGVSKIKSGTVYLDGVRWHSLYSFYNTYKKTHPKYTAIPVDTTWWVEIPEGLGGIGGKSVDMSLPVLKTSGDPRAVRAGRLVPAFVGLYYPFYLSTYNITDATNMGIRIHYSPKMVFHNPWSVALKEYTDDVSSKQARMIYSNTLLQGNTLEIYNLSKGNSLIYKGKLTPIDEGDLVISPANSSMSFEPGQIKVFGSDRSIEGTSQYKHYNDPKRPDSDPPRQYPLVEDFLPELDALNYWNLNLIADDGPALESGDQIRIILSANVDYEGGTHRNHLLFDNESLGYTAFNATTPNAVYTLVDSVSDGTEASTFLDPKKIATLTMRAKGRSPENTPHVPAFGGPGGLWNPLNLAKNPYFWDVQFVPGLGAAGSGGDTVFETDGTNAWWGEVDVGLPGSPSDLRIILKEIFDQPLISIGQFKNADTVEVNSLYPVGNSWADPELVPASGGGDPAQLWHVKKVDTDDILVTADDSFLNNEALFDQFFFSTIPPAVLPVPEDTVLPEEWLGWDDPDRAQAAVDGDERLLHPRLAYYRPNDVSPSVQNLRDMDKAAAHLLADGAFNVNSTSVPAWRALLGSLRYFDTPTPAYPVPRLISDLSAAPINDDYATGMRVLSDDQIDNLAEAIVEQVKLRGPFLSMADFVNRRLVSGALGESGALQAAIDNSGINSAALAALGQTTDLTGPKPGDDPIVFPTNGGRHFVGGITPSVPENTAAGAPGIITQADFLQPLAPLLTARSDTFRIRFYGRSQPAVSIRASDRVSVVGEAVVQRVPDWIDQADPALTDGDNLGNATPPDSLNSINDQFGRRLKVVSYRWLNPDEI